MNATGVSEATVIGVDVKTYPDGYKKADEVVADHFLMKGVTMESRSS
ncbi:hypothetical protein KKB40_01480 [Patescibacteria group bacterium]|nr:hypothetical protein [Patescibacteria group bacterium]